MRIGEIRNKIKQILGDGNIIVIESEPQFEGQAYIINDFDKFIEVLDILSQQSWNDASYAEILAIKEKYGVPQKLLVDQNEFNQINAYISILNQKVPLYFSMVNSFADEQEENVINIKLPENIQDIKKLNELNKNLDTLFKEFNFVGEFKFHGFDRGSFWYEILITGTLLYKYFIACIGVALIIVQLKKTYYGSEQAKINYLTSLGENEKPNEQGQKTYSDKYIEIFLQEKIREVVEKIKDTNGKEKPEICSQLVKATTDLVRQLGEGIEFHLSLNPPKYALEEDGQIVIDYSSMPRELKEEEPKKLEAPKPKVTKELNDK